MDMIKQYHIDRDRWPEVSDWLVEHVSKENIRWWATKGVGQWDGIAAKYVHDMNLSIDVANEEEHILTTFILKYL
jgi:hypothetical protein